MLKWGPIEEEYAKEHGGFFFILRLRNNIAGWNDGEKLRIKGKQMRYIGKRTFEKE